MDKLFADKKPAVRIAGIAIIVLSAFLLIRSALTDKISFPLDKISLEKSLKAVRLDWAVVKEDSLDESNAVYQLKNANRHERLIVSSMNKDGMISLGLAINNIHADSDWAKDEVFDKKLLHLACKLSGIKNQKAVYNDLMAYMSKRDHKIFGSARWYYRKGDKMVFADLKASDDHPNKYYIEFVSVVNMDFFDELKKTFANHKTDRFIAHPDLGVPIYQNIGIKDFEDLRSQLKEDVVRVVIKGELSDTRALEQEKINDRVSSNFDPLIYAGDYAESTITDDTGKIDVFSPAYFLNITDRISGEKLWHIDYYPSEKIFIVDYGADVK